MMIDRTRLKLAYGNWVVGKRFWGREKDIELFVERIDDGAHLLLVAQRRMGKTSLMKEVAQRLSERYVCVFVDFQKALSAPDAVAEMSLQLRPHRNLWKKTTDLFGNILRAITKTVEKVDLGDLGVTLRAGLTAGNWASKGDQLFAILAASERPVLLLLDEVPIMVNRLLKGDDHKITPKQKAAADEFMSWLRKNSIQHQDRVRIVLSGSIGLEPILRQAGLSATVNNFSPFELKAWDDPTAIGCLEALAKEYGVRFQKGVPEEVLNRLGYNIPHHVQVFFAHIYDLCKRREQMEFSIDEIDEVYTREMLSTRGHVELAHYEERLKPVLGEDALPLALDMLTETAVSGHLSREAILSLQKYYSFEDRNIVEVRNEIIWVLEHDGYLKSSPNGYVFVSNLLRDWWKARYEAFYTVVSERRI
ncbi:MAG: ATP-binding protein [bacterium]